MESVNRLSGWYWQSDWDWVCGPAILAPEGDSDVVAHEAVLDHPLTPHGLRQKSQGLLRVTQQQDRITVLAV